MASEKVTAIVEELKTLTVLELSELVSAVEEEFGVSAAAAVAVAAPAEGGAAAADEKTEFDVVLAEVGANKIQVSRLFVKQQVLDLRKLRKSLITLLRLLRKQFQQLTLKLLRLSLKKLAQRLNSSNSTFKFTFMKQAQPFGCACFFHIPIFFCAISITLNATPDSANHISENGTQTWPKKLSGTPE